MRFRTLSRKLLTAGSLAALLAGTASLAFSANAQSVWTGNTSNDWFVGTNWSTGSSPTDADIVIINGGTNNAAIISNPSTPAMTGNLYIGSTVAGNGIGTGSGYLNIQANSSLISDGNLVIGQGQGAEGTLVTENDVSISVADSLLIGTEGGTGHFTLNNAGNLYVANQTIIGDGAGSNGTLTLNSSSASISGMGPDPEHPIASVSVGTNGGTGTLEITADDSEAYSADISISENMIMGDGSGSKGTLTLKGSTAYLYVGGLLSAGTNSGTAEINLSNEDAPYLSQMYQAHASNFLLGADGGTGILNISANANFLTMIYGILGRGTGSSAIANITGGGSLVFSSSDGGGVYNPTSTIALDGGTATLNVSGIGSFTQNSALVFQNGMSLGQGTDSVGTINVFSSGKLTTQTGMFNQFEGNHQILLGVDGGTGNINVSGNDSVWYVGSDSYAMNRDDPDNNPPANLYIGYTGTGNVTISDNALLSVGWLQRDSNCGDTGCYFIVSDYGGTGTIHIADQAGSTGNLNIGAAPGNAPAASGTILAASIQFGDGNGALNFNLTDTDFQFTIPVSGNGTIANYAGTTWLAADNSGFSGATNLYGGTLGLENSNSLGTSLVSVLGNAVLAYNDAVSIDNGIKITENYTLTALTSGGFSASQNGVISGTGNFSKTGTGTLMLTGTNTYTGKTTVSEGVLALSGTGSISESSVVQVDSIFDITAVTSGSSEIKSLSGGGQVLLGENDLVITSANDTFSGVISGNGGLQVTGGTETLSGANTYLGDTIVSGGTLRAGAQNTFSSSSAVTTSTGGMLDLNGYSQSIAALTNGGVVRTGGTPPGTVLTVNGNYIGTGGTLILNTMLGADSSPTDQLVVSGAGNTASGTTNLVINNVNGSGALTTGNGIPVVVGTNGGSVADATFVQSSRIAAGAYEYTLYQNGINGDSNDGNWYLRNVLATDGNNGGTDGGDNGSGNGGGAGTDTGSSGTTNTFMPDYRVEVPLATSILPIAVEYGYSMLGTLHERNGGAVPQGRMSSYDELTVRGKSGKPAVIRTHRAAPQQWFSGAWGRLIGDRGLRDTNNFSKNGPKYDYTFAGLQAGLDIYSRETAQGVDKAGVYVGYGNISANVKGAYGNKAGTIDMDAYTVGAYWTHIATQGWYTDAVIQGTWYSADATSVYGQKLKPDGFGFIASLEGGYSFYLGNGLTFEPQAQIAYQHTSFDKFSDAYGRFSIEDGKSLRGRIGARLSKTWNMSETGKPRAITTWVRANIWHEFMGNTKTTTTNLYGLNGVTIPSDLGGTWAEIGAGVSAQVSDNVSLFTTGSYNHSLDNKGRQSWNGRLGATIRW
ncbi:autotransporter outer membrane beta-barrel domain-containing protein [Microvirga sp. W0021]|uniref:Autotransporter outer membrane beta-barrel domain-containing protein n=1 Tax=Hohaiivirga grylli TaxID=3133970 RepID=A0ABV0BG27_9HYPH